MSENQTLINWYPGHMARTRRLLQDQIKRIDLIIELCDARLPSSSRNPDLDRMISHKRRLLFLNKSDLAEQRLNEEWLRFFRRQGMGRRKSGRISLYLQRCFPQTAGTRTRAQYSELLLWASYAFSCQSALFFPLLVPQGCSENLPQQKTAAL